MEWPQFKIENGYSVSRDSRWKKSSSSRGIFSLAGQSSCGSTRKARARQSSSKSETQRSCVSILANVCRLKSHPHRWQRAASIGWVSPCWSRNRRICRPTRFRGFVVMFRFPNRNTRATVILKGSEFRTLIWLAKGGRRLGESAHGDGKIIFWKELRSGNGFHPVNKSMKPKNLEIGAHGLGVADYFGKTGTK